MNRKIIFRGKSLNTGLWTYGDLRQDNIRRKAYIEYEVDPDTIGQYTGLKDKNGKEIYEGDIVYSGATVGVVVYDNKQAGFVVQKENTIELRFYSLLGIEVIDNIHDNPELLKQQRQ